MMRCGSAATCTAEQVRGIAVDTLEQQAGGRAFIPAVNFFWQAPTGGK